MKISNKCEFNPNYKILEFKNNYKIDNTLGQDVFNQRCVSFTGNQNFPFKHLGLSLSRLEDSGFQDLFNHANYVIKASKQTCFDIAEERNILDTYYDLKKSVVHLIKDHEGKIVGSGALLIKKDINEAGISYVYIHPDWQRKGLGSWIIKDLLKKGEENNISCYKLLTENPIAEKIYKQCGFEKICKLKSGSNEIMMLKGNFPKIFKIFKYLPEKIQTKLFVEKS